MQPVEKVEQQSSGDQGHKHRRTDEETGHAR
jgi:hypothetical protein